MNAAADGVAASSTITEPQLKLMSIHDALQFAEWQMVEIRRAVSGPAPTGDPDLHEELMRLQLLLAAAQGFCLNHACPNGTL